MTGRREHPTAHPEVPWDALIDSLEQIRRICLRRARRGVAAEDLVQDVVLRFALYCTRHGSPVHPERWIARVAMAAAADAARREARRNTEIDLAAVASELVAHGDWGGGELAAQVEFERIAEDTRQSLPPVPGAVATLRLEGLTLDRVAQSLGVSVATAWRAERVFLRAVARRLGFTRHAIAKVNHRVMRSNSRKNEKLRVARRLSRGNRNRRDET